MRKQRAKRNTNLYKLIIGASSVVIAIYAIFLINYQFNISNKQKLSINPTKIIIKKETIQILSAFGFFDEIGSPLLTSKIVCIDPGHQAFANLDKEPIRPGSYITKAKVTGGAVGVFSRVPEYKIVLEISQKLKVKLEQEGIKVILTRSTNNVDLSNIDRAKIANNLKADLFIRIHADSNLNKSANGYSILYPKRNQWTENIYEKSKRAAQIVSDELSTTGSKNNGIVPRGDLTGFNWSKVPSILIETGFLSNNDEDKLLNSDAYQQKITRGIIKGIIAYLNNEAAKSNE